MYFGNEVTVDFTLPFEPLTYLSYELHGEVDFPSYIDPDYESIYPDYVQGSFDIGRSGPSFFAKYGTPLYMVSNTIVSPGLFIDYSIDGNQFHYKSVMTGTRLDVLNNNLETIPSGEAIFRIVFLYNLPGLGLGEPNDPGGANITEASLVYSQITPVPIPAAAWLFGSGLLGLIGISRRKKAA